MDNLHNVHDSLMRRLQLIERKVSLQSIQLGQALDMLNRLSNKNANESYFKELNTDAASKLQPGQHDKSVGPGVVQAGGRSIDTPAARQAV